MLMDVLLCLVLEGSAAGAQSAKLPFPLRVVLMLLIVMVFGALTVFMLLGAFVGDSFALRLICLGVAAGCAAYLVVFLHRVWKIWKS